MCARLEIVFNTHFMDYGNVGSPNRKRLEICGYDKGPHWQSMTSVITSLLTRFALMNTRKPNRTVWLLCKYLLTTLNEYQSTETLILNSGL